MAEVAVTTQSGAVYADPTWDAEDIPEFIEAVRSASSSEFAIVLDVEDEQQVIIPWREIALVRISGVGHTKDWA